MSGRVSTLTNVEGEMMMSRESRGGEGRRTWKGKAREGGEERRGKHGRESRGGEGVGWRRDDGREREENMEGEARRP